MLLEVEVEAVSDPDHSDDYWGGDGDDDVFKSQSPPGGGSGCGGASGPGGDGTIDAVPLSPIGAEMIDVNRDNTAPPSANPEASFQS
jgi:hypothetical protein